MVINQPIIQQYHQRFIPKQTNQINQNINHIFNNHKDLNMILMLLFPENMTLISFKEHNNNNHNFNLMQIHNKYQLWNPNLELHNQ